MSRTIGITSYADSVFHWVDSMTVLYWIKKDKPWKQYIGHHIREIHQLTAKNQWRHCPGILNPADLLSRGTTGKELMQSTQEELIQSTLW